jgi:4-hydroxybenzoate polyprenyltransferase
MSLIYGILLIITIGTFLLMTQRKLFFALLWNVRFPQVIYHGGLALLGVISAFFFAHLPFRPSFFDILAIITLIAAIVSAWIASVIINDSNDQNIDTLTNPDRPLPRNEIDAKLYQTIGISFFLASILLAGIISFQILLLLICYQMIAWVYSVPPFRLKRFPPIASFSAACASILILLSGFLLIAPDQLGAFPKPIIFFLLIAYTIALPIKDFKDTLGDRRDGVMTIPVLIGEAKAKLFLGGALFLLFIGSVFVLHAPKLTFAAFFFGTIAFWLVQKSSREQRLFPYRHLAGWLISLVIIYGVLIIAALF